MPRPRKCRLIAENPVEKFYKPQGIKMRDLNQIILHHDQLEALRLADADRLDQIKAAAKMNISRSTFSRLVNEARYIVATALVNGWALKIEGGNFEVQTEKISKINMKG